MNEKLVEEEESTLYKGFEKEKNFFATYKKIQMKNHRK